MKKIEVVYIKHSGTAVIFDDLLLLFDLEKTGIPEEARNRPVIIFASHVHPDHFDPEILSFGRENKEVAYCLSSDIILANNNNRQTLEGLNITSVDPDMQYMLEADGKSVKIKTLGSTDQGVAFIVEYNGCTIFHAGDLNCWAWPKESEEYQRREIADYQREINKLINTNIDVAFVPLDPRLKDNFSMCMEYFIDNIQCNHVIPIHMWGRYEFIDKLKEKLDSEQKEKILHTEYEGQRFQINIMK